MERVVVAADGVSIAADVFGASTGRAPVVCVPGLTRNARDFSELASRLSPDRLVVAVDLRGRGRSGRDPTAQSYNLDVYASDMVLLCEELGIDAAVWIGTSLGGLVSMYVGASAPERVAGIVLNDIGPELAPEGLARIGAYAGSQQAVSSWSDAAAQVRLVSESQAAGLSDEQWLDEARNRYTEMPDGRVLPDYDLAVANGPPPQHGPWWAFEHLGDLPVVVLRGAMSDLLTPETVRSMQSRHPGTSAVEVPERGHAPMLNEPVARQAIDEFLAEIDRRRQAS